MSGEPNDAPPGEARIESTVFDDVDARPGSTVSLLRTVIGLYLRRLGGRVFAADIVRLMADLGIPDGRTRTALARVKRNGLLLADREQGIGYRLNPAAVPMLERGDYRIFAPRRMDLSEGWCLISFSVPESRRDLRHQLRRRLSWIGCGRVSSALWVCPDHLGDEVVNVLTELGALPFSHVFRAATVVLDSPSGIGDWWNLASLRREHNLFHTAIAPIQESLRIGPPEPAASFAGYVRLIDAWRVLPYADPGLPTELLPPEWPGTRSLQDFNALSDRLVAAAWAHVRAVVDGGNRRH